MGGSYLSRRKMIFFWFPVALAVAISIEYAPGPGPESGLHATEPGKSPRHATERARGDRLLLPVAETPSKHPSSIPASSRLTSQSVA